jgi:hypothetical protein
MRLERFKTWLAGELRKRPEVASVVGDTVRFIDGTEFDLTVVRTSPSMHDDDHSKREVTYTRDPDTEITVTR